MLIFTHFLCRKLTWCWNNNSDILSIVRLSPEFSCRMSCPSGKNSYHFDTTLQSNPQLEKQTPPIQSWQNDYLFGVWVLTVCIVHWQWNTCVSAAWLVQLLFTAESFGYHTTINHKTCDVGVASLWVTHCRLKQWNRTRSFHAYTHICLRMRSHQVVVNFIWHESSSAPVISV